MIEPKSVPDSGDPAWDLALRVKNGQPLVLTSKVITILRRSARKVGIEDSEVVPALRSVERAGALLRKIQQRIRRNTWRLMRALVQMYRLRDAGDLEGAREQMRKVLAVDPDPHHRRIARGQLEQLEDWQPPTKRRPGKGTRTKATKPGKPSVRKLTKAAKARPRKATPRKP